MKKILLTLLAMALMLPALPARPARAAALKDDGAIRVWLKSLEDPAVLNVTASGSYALEHNGAFRVSDGAQLTFSMEDGAIWLSAGGLALDLGPSVTLTRQSAGSGVYIDEAAQPNLYAGDLSLSATATGIRPILTLPVEEYLLGVVAYEMSDSFPLEALKAQAVAARTYALQRKWAAGRRAYDLVDTTADQVYKGYDPEYVNVEAAVRATEGLVGTYNGAPATCYYTASNGGQTALPSQLWGDTANDAYLAMVDDPYDLENPSSLVNDLTFSPACEGSAKLRQMLLAALKSPMKRLGFGDWVLDKIVAIEPVNPRFEGSYLYDDLAFDLAVKVPESALASPSADPSADPSASPSVSPSASPSATPAADLPPEPEKWAPLDQTVRVTLSVFDDIKEGLSMGLNGADCELIAVERDGADFRLVMRRFGHGVGMSQRGAQQMAGEHGMDYMEILEFYYPGLRFERLTWPEATPAPVYELPSEARAVPTPTPSPAPLPRAAAGERVAIVEATSLNVREAPTTQSRVVDILDRGREVLAQKTPDADGWVRIRTGEVEGYVREEYLGD